MMMKEVIGCGRGKSTETTFTNIFTNRAWWIWTGIWIVVTALLTLVLLFSRLTTIALIGVIVAFYLITTTCVFLLPNMMAAAKADDQIEQPKADDQTEQPPRKDRLSLENDIRETLLQVVAGAALIGTFFYGFQQLNATQRQALDAREQFEEQSTLVTEQQAAERFARAIDHLSSERTEARLGGIATLVQIAESSIAQRSLPQPSGSRVQRHDYQENVLGYLSGFLRSISRGKHPTYDGDPQALPALAVRLPEAQAAIDAINRLNHDRPNQPAKKQLELFKVDLIGARLEKYQLNNLDLTGAYLTGADLRGTNLEGTNLTGADLRGARLEGADITGAQFSLQDCPAPQERGGCEEAIADHRTAWPNNTKPGGVLEPTIEITAPANNSDVPYRATPNAPEGVTVTGNWNDLRQDAYIWVAVYIKKVKRYYPHNIWLDYSEFGQKPKWEIQNVVCGKEDERRLKCALVAIMADSDGTRAFQDYLSQQEQPGMLALPMGATELSRVDVTRE